MITEPNKQNVKFASFTDNGEILIKTDNRFSLFDQNGNFLKQVKFSDQIAPVDTRKIKFNKTEKL